MNAFNLYPPILPWFNWTTLFSLVQFKRSRNVISTIHRVSNTTNSFQWTFFCRSIYGWHATSLTPAPVNTIGWPSGGLLKLLYSVFCIYTEYRIVLILRLTRPIYSVNTEYRIQNTEYRIQNTVCLSVCLFRIPNLT